LYVTAKLFIR